jgi:predicted GIY-YIG superfamily endonuclease
VSTKPAAGHKWNREWKLARIEMDNPDWEDLALKLEP